MPKLAIGAPAEKYAVFLNALKPFTTTTGNLRGRLNDGNRVMPSGARLALGALPDEYRVLFEGNLPDIDYFVWSWQTPIAWHYAATHSAGARWVIPAVIYSLSTTPHQETIRWALDGQYESGPQISIRKGRGARRGAFGPGWQTRRSAPQPQPPVQEPWSGEPVNQLPDCVIYTEHRLIPS